MNDDIKKCWLCGRDENQLKNEGYSGITIEMKELNNYYVPICEVCDDLLFSYVIKINESYVAKDEIDEIVEEILSHLKIHR